MPYKIGKAWMESEENEKIPKRCVGRKNEAKILRCDGG